MVYSNNAGGQQALQPHDRALRSGTEQCTAAADGFWFTDAGRTGEQSAPARDRFARRGLSSIALPQGMDYRPLRHPEVLSELAIFGEGRLVDAPGSIITTRTPNGLTSMRRASLSPSRANLEALYID